MKKLILIFFIIITGCYNQLKIERSNLDVQIQLDESQYDIIGNISGEASVTYIWLLLPFPINFKTGYGKLEYPAGYYYPFRGETEQNAIYDAIQSADGVDAIITPKFERRITGFPPFFWTVNVKVNGKGIIIKEG